MLEGQTYGKFDEDYEASKTYGTMGDNPMQVNHMGLDNPGFQESTFTEYPNNQVVYKFNYIPRAKWISNGSLGFHISEPILSRSWPGQPTGNSNRTARGGDQSARVHSLNHLHAEIDEDPLLDEPVLLDVARLLLALLYRFRWRSRLRW